MFAREARDRPAQQSPPDPDDFGWHQHNIEAGDLEFRVQPPDRCHALDPPQRRDHAGVERSQQVGLQFYNEGIITPHALAGMLMHIVLRHSATSP